MNNIKKEELRIAWENMKEPSRALFEEALQYAIEKVRSNLSDFTDFFPSPAGLNNNYSKEGNDYGWTTGFWSGMIWISYAVTKDEEFLKAGKIHSKSFKQRLEKDVELQHHDLGFLYSLSCVADYILTGDNDALVTSLGAANRLAKMYRPIPGIIQRGGNMEDLNDKFTGVFIVDCLMNIPFWYWIARETNATEFKKMAYKHAQNSLASLVRENAAVNQNGTADVHTGNIFSDPMLSQGKGGLDACWSRGQAWAMYGFALSYDYTGDDEFIEISKKLTNFYLNRLPDDYIANWDLFYTGNDDQRDTSAASIAVCGMLDLASHLPLYDESRKNYEIAALKMLESLTVNYLTKQGEDTNALLKAGVYAYTLDNGVNEPCIWGDYFYMEALWRALGYFKRFW